MEQKLSLRKRLAFAAITAAIALLGLELLLQGFYYLSAGAFLFQRVSPPILEADPNRCYRMKSDLAFEMRTNEFSSWIYTNDQGLRTDSRRAELSPDKPPGVYRVLFLGPSFAFGWGSDWEDSYAGLIGEKLRVPGRRVEVMNLGTPAQAQEPQLCWLRAEGHRFEPDLVVTTVYGNQLAPLPAGCPERLECPHVEGGRLYSARPTLRRRAIAAAKNLATVFYGYYLAMALAPASEAPSRAEGIGKELYSEREREGAGSLDAIADGYPRYAEEVKRILGDRVQVAFIHLPLSFAIHPEDSARWWHLTDASPSRARAEIEAAAAALRQRGVPLIQPTPALLERAGHERLYYWLDIHLTPAGNRIVAEAALPVLEELAMRQLAAASRP